MKRLSSKPTVYLIDGSNFSLRFGDSPSAELENEFVDWFKTASALDMMRGSEFRITFDGPCRRKFPPGLPIIIYYTDSEPADELLLERGYFMRKTGQRAVIISSDRELRERARRDSILTMTCEQFLSLVQREIDKYIR